VTGQELALANQRGIPVLRLSPGGEPISRQITGDPFVDARPYQLPDELAAAVTQFLVNNKTALLDGPRWRRSKTIIYCALQSDLLTAWRTMSSPTRRGKAAAGAQVTPAFLDQSLGHPLLVATIAHHQLLAVRTELGIDVASYFTSPTGSVALADRVLGGEGGGISRPHRVVSTPSLRSAFVGYRFPPEVILLAVRWYLRYGLSYRDVEELLAERGIDVDHVTIYRWVQRFTPLLIDAARSCRHAVGGRWFVDETYVKVVGKWRYVYRAVDQHGQVIDVYVSARRDIAAARRFFSAALAAHGEPDEVVADLAQALETVSRS